ncbi:alpha/beta hydrolase [Nocardia sp. NPDC058497]|uniref:alpha/beta hydrolase n=1 Tax=Nocardia sp. NPDC058497 TaxID=3346529 RepID=UPI00364A3A66
MSPASFGAMLTRAVGTVAVAVAMLVVVASPSGAQPGPGSPDRAMIDHVEQITDRWHRVFVASPAMGRIVEVQVLLPSHGETPRPTVYLLDGRAADPAGNTWITRADAVDFFADKPVNVVLTVGGPVSYYTDWQRPDPVLGTYQWETFLTRELPPLLDATYHGNGTKAVAGLSMGAQGAFMLAARNPGDFAAVAGFSGCYTSTGLGEAQLRAVVASMGGNADNMFGPSGDPNWAAHDVIAHAESLRSTAVYLSAGTGVPGTHDTTGNPAVLDAVVFGGPLESGASLCTRRLAARLDALGIAATVNLRATGTHSWPYWSAELRSAWPLLAAALSEPRKES